MTRAPLTLPALPPLVVDAGIAALAAAGSMLIDAFGPDHRTTGALFWDVALALPLVLRRRAPALAAATIGAIALAQWLSQTLASGDVAVLLMLYALAAWDGRRWLLATAVAVAELGVVLAVTRWAPPEHAWLSALMVTGTVTASWVLGVYVRTRRAYLATMIERAERAERDRDNQARIAVDAERARMAREMHDIVAHSLSVMITLTDAAAAISRSDDVRGTVVQASDVGRQALAEMHRMLAVFRDDRTPELSPQPDVSRLPELVGIVRSAGLSVDLAVTGDLGSLTASAQLVVYRIVQESLTNVLKHARNVTRVVVELGLAGGTLTVRVRNDGDTVARRGGSAAGHGLTGMQERAGLYTGHVDAGPVAGGGWLVEADLSVADAVSTR